MKAVTELWKNSKALAAGHSTRLHRQVFEVEPSDVGTRHPHHMNHNLPGPVFTEADVGRHIEMLSGNGSYRYWEFLK